MKENYIEERVKSCTGFSAFGSTRKAVREQKENTAKRKIKQRNNIRCIHRTKN